MWILNKEGRMAIRGPTASEVIESIASHGDWCLECESEREMRVHELQGDWDREREV